MERKTRCEHNIGFCMPVYVCICVNIHIHVKKQRYNINIKNRGAGQVAHLVRVPSHYIKIVVSIPDQ